MIDSKKIEMLYTTGMAFASQLRLIGEDEAAHEIEVYVLDMKLKLERSDDQK